MLFIQEYKLKKYVYTYLGVYRVRSFTCREHFNVMSLVQVTDRETLDSIKSCLINFSSMLYDSGVNTPVTRNTLAKANKNRDWPIYVVFAQPL